MGRSRIAGISPAGNRMRPTGGADWNFLRSDFQADEESIRLFSLRRISTLSDVANLSEMLRTDRLDATSNCNSQPVSLLTPSSCLRVNTLREADRKFAKLRPTASSWLSSISADDFSVWCCCPDPSLHPMSWSPECGYETGRRRRRWPGHSPTQWPQHPSF